MGAQVERATEKTTVRGTGQLRGIDADMFHISDTVMTLAAIAPLAAGPTAIRNVANIRIKETDRLAATVAELRRLGQEVSEGPDWLRIEPRPITPAIVHSYKDHRMAMSFAILGAVKAGVSIEDMFVKQNFFLYLGTGNDDASASDVEVCGNAYIYGGPGSDSVGLEYFAVANNLFVFMGGDDDELSITDSSAEIARLYGDGGYDIYFQGPNSFGQQFVYTFEASVL